MKTFRQFNEDAQSFSQDKEAYEKQMAAKEKLSMRRRESTKDPIKLSKKYTGSKTDRQATQREIAQQKRSEYLEKTKQLKDLVKR